MHRAVITSGKTACRYCGELMSINKLSVHIANTHRRQVATGQQPTLVRKASMT